MCMYEWLNKEPRWRKFNRWGGYKIGQNIFIFTKGWERIELYIEKNAQYKEKTER